MTHSMICARDKRGGADDSTSPFLLFLLARYAIIAFRVFLDRGQFNKPVWECSQSGNAVSLGMQSVWECSQSGNETSLEIKPVWE